MYPDYRILMELLVKQLEVLHLTKVRLFVRACSD